ncbi:MAG: hypothetical protein FWE57_01415 [Chitinispirillia bacterium]|nr:hypothetical protein [Chitinispirillia bacterium]
MADGLNVNPSSPHSALPPSVKKGGASASKLAAKGIPEERIKFLDAIKEQISQGYYNSDKVTDDLSHAFTKAVDVLISLFWLTYIGMPQLVYPLEKFFSSMLY